MSELTGELIRGQGPLWTKQITTKFLRTKLSLWKNGNITRKNMIISRQVRFWEKLQIVIIWQTFSCNSWSFLWNLQFHLINHFRFVSIKINLQLYTVCFLYKCIKHSNRHIYMVTSRFITPSVISLRLWWVLRGTSWFRCDRTELKVTQLTYNANGEINAFSC